MNDRLVRYDFAGVALGLLLALTSAGLAEVVVYPGPAGVDPSDQYAVEIV